MEKLLNWFDYILNRAEQYNPPYKSAPVKWDTPLGFWEYHEYPWWKREPTWTCILPPGHDGPCEHS